MFLDLPILSSTNSSTEFDRIERLGRVYGYAVALADTAGNTEFINKLAQLHDHKGVLTVYWHTDPTDEEKQYFVRAWKSQVGDGTDRVEHVRSELS